MNFGLLSGQNIKGAEHGQSKSECHKSYNERFADWIMVDKGIKKRDAVWKAYRIGKVQRDYGMQITTQQEAEKVAALIMASDYQKSTKRQKLYSLEDWIRFQGLPVIHFKKPRATERCPNYLNQDQLSSLIHAANNYREYAILALFVFTGARLGEVAGLDVGSINFTNHTLTLKETKNGKDRIVSMHTGMESVLREYLYRRGMNNLEADSPLFTSYRSQRLSGKRMEDIVKEVAKRAGLVGVHPHILRHSFATAWVENGGDPFNLQWVLGHSDIQTTVRYWHWDRNTARAAFEKGMPRLS